MTGPPATDMPPPPPIPPLTPQASSADDAEAKRLAELERQRLAEEEKKKWERLRAPQVVADNANAATLDAAKAARRARSKRAPRTIPTGVFSRRRKARASTFPPSTSSTGPTRS